MPTRDDDLSDGVETIPGAGMSDSVPENPHAFTPDVILAGRYRVIRFAASGGMGEVYEVEDLLLRGHLALKTIRPEMARNQAALERFKREINIARRITHPNVSRIFDVGIHHGPPETMFLTMEFLPGTDLYREIHRKGQLPEQEALPLIEQIAAGLSAAHAIGVIHRDFKSANVMLVPATGASPRAVVTDFGLAHLTVSEEGMTSMSETGVVVGTPAYMAPEQVEGKPLTSAADIYALGIVMYEMATGRLPFGGSSPLAMATKRLTDSPTPPIQLVPAISPAWNNVILRCLEREPERRFASATDIALALRNAGSGGNAWQPGLYIGGHDTPTVQQLVRPAPRRRGFLTAGAILLMTLLLIALWPHLKSEVAPSEPIAPRASVSLRPRLAILGLRNDSGQADTGWIATAIAEMLASELRPGGKILLVPAHDVAAAKADLGLQDGVISKNDLIRLRRRLDVQTLILGKYTIVGGSTSSIMQLDLSLLDTATGQVLATSSTSGTKNQLFDLVSRALSGGPRHKLGLVELTNAESVALEAAVPSTVDAMRLYAEGVSRLTVMEPAGARDLLLKAGAADRQNALVQSALSAAYSALGYEIKAKEAAERALAQSGHLDPQQKLQIALRAYEASKQWDKAVDISRSLWTSFPDSVEYGLELADAQISSGKPREALVTIDALHALPLPASADGRIDLAEAHADDVLGNPRAQLKCAVAAANKGHDAGARLLVARARLNQGSALITLGQMADATTALDESRTLFEAAADREGVAQTWELAAIALDRQGDLDGARRLLERAQSIHHDFGNEAGEARVLHNLGVILLRQDRTIEAEDHFEKALQTFHGIGAQHDEAASLNEIGAMMFNRGDLSTSQKRYEAALDLFNSIHEQVGTAMALTNIGEVLECRGSLAEARKMHEDALEVNREIGDKNGIAWDTSRIAEILALGGDLIAARDKYSDSLTLYTQIGDKLGVAETQLSLAIIGVQEGKAADAERLARGAEQIMRTEGTPDRSALALSVVSSALLAQGKQQEAFDTAQTARKLAANAEDHRVRHTVAVNAARAQAASKRPADVDKALAILAETTADASHTSFLISELESRLAAGEIEAAAGRASARQDLAGLVSAARTKGFNWIAQRASATLASLRSTS